MSSIIDKSEYEDIRAFNDSEISEVIKALKSNKQFQKFMCELLKSSASWSERLFINLFFKRYWRRYFAKYLDSVTTVKDLQKYVHIMIGRVLKRTNSTVVSSGFKTEYTQCGQLYISNHRDITLDAALLSYCLAQRDLPTSYNAAGDNLMDRQFVETLMRANKTFVVRRGLSLRDTLLSAKKLSLYISFLRQQKNNIWLAQRSGRAKNGEDITDHNVIKMLFMSKPKKQLTADFLQHICLTPMAISYEWDPCDCDKAMELEAQEAQEFGTKYIKAAGEDFKSICKGIFGDKGTIGLHIGTPIMGEQFASVESLATEIDRQIAKNYQLFPSNLAAYYLLGHSLKDLGLAFEDASVAEAITTMEARISHLNKRQSELLLQAYAQPIFAKLAL